MFRFTIRDLLGLVAVEAVIAAFAKKVLAADSLEELVVVLGVMAIVGGGYLGLLAIVRLVARSDCET